MSVVRRTEIFSGSVDCRSGGDTQERKVQAVRTKYLMSNPHVYVHIKVAEWRTHCETHLPYTALTLEPTLVHLPELSSPKL